MIDVYDTHDLADLRSALGCGYNAGPDEMADRSARLRTDVARLRSTQIHDL